MSIQAPQFTEEEVRRLGPIFNRIRHAVSVSSEEKTRKRDTVFELLKRLTNLMRGVEPLFEKMFVEFIYTGSFFDGLRIIDANEFDINLVLKLPVRSDRIMLDLATGPATYAYLAVEYSRGEPTVDLDYGIRGRFCTLLDKHFRAVHPGLVLSWMRSVVDKALFHKSRLLNGLEHIVENVLVSSSGPALTLTISVRLTPGHSEIINVDLVPSFRYHRTSMGWTETNTSFQHQLLNIVEPSKQDLYLIPKVLSLEVNKHLWRKHFPDVERCLLHGTAKNVIKILKLLRDNCRWNNLASYYIKTLVMTEMIENPGLTWHDRYLPQLVFMMLAKLANCLRNLCLPHLMYKDQNLLEHLNSLELINISGHIKRILQKCKADVEKVNLYFLPSSALFAPEAAMQETELEEYRSTCGVH